MKWGDKSYHTLNYELKKIFGSKVIKLSLNGGFTCPNRDGTLDTRGCIFCSEHGAGDFCDSPDIDIAMQIEHQKRSLMNKWKADKYIAYFQNYTNTYSSVDDLKSKYSQALSQKGIVGLAIATRPDCLSNKILDLLEQINSYTYLWIELGLQSIHNNTAHIIRRKYDLECFENAVRQLNSRNIRIVTHVIFGFPWESRQNMIETIQYIANKNIYGIKIHMLYVQKNTDLYKLYVKKPFRLMSKDEYISLVTDALEILPPEMVIHRLTGDGPKNQIVAPKWTFDKLSVLSGIDKEFKLRNTYQGIRYNK